MLSASPDFLTRGWALQQPQIPIIGSCYWARHVVPFTEALDPPVTQSPVEELLKLHVLHFCQNYP